MGMQNRTREKSRKRLAPAELGKCRRSCGCARGPLDKHAVETMRGLMLILSLAIALVCLLNNRVAQAEVVFSEDA
jgi:hypothetical protein